MHRGLLALILVVAGLPAAAGNNTVSAIDVCLHQLDSALDVGYERITARCPDLVPALSGAAHWLPRDWNQSGNELSAAGLAELRALLTRVDAPAAAARPLNVEHVPGVLAALAQAPTADGGWWDRLKHWLRELFTPRRERAAQPPWLHWLFGDVTLGQGVQRAIVWGALALVMALAAAIIVNELRIAGLLRRHAPRAAAAAADATTTPAGEAGALEQAGVTQQPRLLLELIAARLAAQQRLPPARSLTVHELARAARLPDAADRARLELLGAACERVCFADGQISPPVLAAALTAGRELLAAVSPPHGPLQAA